MGSIAECLTALGNREGAIPWARRAACGGGGGAAQLGALLAAQGDLQGAVDAYTVALRGSPENVELLTSLGILHVRAGQQQMAVERLGSALALGPPQAGALLPMAAIMQSHRDFDVALSRYKIAAQQTPDSPALWNNIGMCFFGKQKYVAAVSCLKRAACLSPLSARVLHNLGLVHAACAQYASAFHFLCAALNLRGGTACTYMVMAITLDHLEDHENAMKAYEQAVLLDPDDIMVRINYSLFLISAKQLEQAKYHLSVAEELAAKMAIVEKDCSEALVKLRILTDPGTSSYQDTKENRPGPMIMESETAAEDQEDFVDPDEV